MIWSRVLQFWGCISSPWWNEAPTSRIERASVESCPPQVVRVADLSRFSPLGIDKETLSNIRSNVSFHRLAWYHALIGE